MRPRLIKTENLAPVRLDRKGLHEAACAYVEELYGRKGELAAHFMLAVGTRLVVIETAWSDDREKYASQEMLRAVIKVLGVHAYSFISEVWTASLTNDMEDAEYWLRFADEHGVSQLPEHMRDDVVLTLSFDRDGGVSNSRYVAQVPKRGPRFLGPRIDEEEDGGFEGRMASLFDASYVKPFAEEFVARWLAAKEEGKA